MHRHWYSTDTPSITTNTDTMEVMFSCIFSCSIPTLCTSPPRSWRHWSILWTTQQLTWRTWGPRVPSLAERSRTSSRSETLVWSRYNIIVEWEKLMAGLHRRVLLQLCRLDVFHLKPPKHLNNCTPITWSESLHGYTNCPTTYAWAWQKETPANTVKGTRYSFTVPTYHWVFVIHYVHQSFPHNGQDRRPEESKKMTTSKNLTVYMGIGGNRATLYLSLGQQSSTFFLVVSHKVSVLELIFHNHIVVWNLTLRLSIPNFSKAARLNLGKPGYKAIVKFPVAFQN